MGRDREEGSQEGGAFVTVTWWAKRKKTPSPKTHLSSTMFIIKQVSIVTG